MTIFLFGLLSGILLILALGIWFFFFGLRAALAACHQEPSPFHAVLRGERTKHGG